MDAPLGTTALVEMLRSRHGPRKGQIREWAFFEQVRSSTWAARTADAIAVNLWPSRGQAIHGYEVKASRSDWLKELRAPDKAETIARYCDYWWVAVSEASLVSDGELPDTWGLMAPSGTKLKVLKQAERQNPRPVSKSFLVEVLRCAYVSVAPETHFGRGRLAGIDEGLKRASQDVETIKGQRDKLAERIRTFEKESGVALDGWSAHDAAETGKALRLVLEGNEEADQVRRRLTTLRDQALRIAEDIGCRLEES